MPVGGEAGQVWTSDSDGQGKWNDIISVIGTKMLTVSVECTDFSSSVSVMYPANYVISNAIVSDISLLAKNRLIFGQTYKNSVKTSPTTATMYHGKISDDNVRSLMEQYFEGSLDSMPDGVYTLGCVLTYNDPANDNFYNREWYPLKCTFKTTVSNHSITNVEFSQYDYRGNLTNNDMYISRNASETYWFFATNLSIKLS